MSSKPKDKRRRNKEVIEEELYDDGLYDDGVYYDEDDALDSVSNSGEYGE
jgi:hypothetical protein